MCFATYYHGKLYFRCIYSVSLSAALLPAPTASPSSITKRFSVFYPALTHPIMVFLVKLYNDQLVNVCACVCMELMFRGCNATPKCHNFARWTTSLPPARRGFRQLSPIFFYNILTCFSLSVRLFISMRVHFFVCCLSAGFQLSCRMGKMGKCWSPIHKVDRIMSNLMLSAVSY